MVDVKAPDGWAELSLRVRMPNHLLRAIMQTVSENLKYGSRTDVNALVVNYDGTDLNGDAVFELFVIGVGQDEVADVAVIVKPTDN